MKREDLRRRIIPTTIGNTDERQHSGNEEFNTTDLIYLDNDEFEKREFKIGMPLTDYALMNKADIVRTNIKGEKIAIAWLRTAFSNRVVFYEPSNIFGSSTWGGYTHLGICPLLHYQLPFDILEPKKENSDESEEIEQFDIREVKDTTGENIYHTLQIGEYPRTKADENLSRKLETLYNGGKIQEGMICTGRWYSGNGQKKYYDVYEGKHSPEFEYQGNRYVRVVSYPYYQEHALTHANYTEFKYSDGTPIIKGGTIRWVKVEPISFIIRNWAEMPKSINPNGTERAKYFDLRAEEAITANIPFYPNDEDKNCTMWQNSSIRGFLNGIDVRNIQSNGNIKYGASRGGNFTGECNFLNEAFNLSREPIIEYTIPDSETEIADDAFNGCITLKKLVLHLGIKCIGKRCFDGINFKYAYRNKMGELVFAQELPQNENEYTNVVELYKLLNSFYGFDYSMLLNSDGLSEISNLSEILSKNKFSIPWVYGLALVQNEKTKSFTENSDFRFFKSEFPQIDKMLSGFLEEEKLDFFKFATCLGCFSTEKIFDKNGKRTEVSLAQKASSLLAIILKTRQMRLRYVSWNI